VVTRVVPAVNPVRAARQARPVPAGPPPLGWLLTERAGEWAPFAPSRLLRRLYPDQR